MWSSPDYTNIRNVYRLPPECIVSEIDPTNPAPKYLQLRDILLDWIEGDRSDNAPPAPTVGCPLPSERDLGAHYGMSRMTVRQTIDALVSEGRVYRVPGKGTFVARPKIEMPLRLTSFSADMRNRGYVPGAEDLVRSTTPARTNLAHMLGIEPGSPVHSIERLRTADGEPMAVERSHVPATLAPGLEEHCLVGRSLYQLLEQEYGLVLDAGEQVIEAGLGNANDSGLLGLAPNSPVLLLRRRSFSGSTCVELAASTYRADRYQLYSRLDRHLPPTQQ